MTSRDPDKGLQAAETLSRDKSINGRILFHELDITRHQSINEIYRWIIERYGHLDILVNNAGVYLDEGMSVFDIDENLMRQTMEVNFHGAFRMFRRFVPLMKQNGFRRIVNISSGYGAMSQMAGYTAAYRISKASLNALTFIMADELRNTSIKVNAVCPGWVSTNMGGSLAPTSPRSAAEDIAHFAMINESDRLVDFSGLEKREDGD